MEAGRDIEYYLLVRCVHACVQLELLLGLEPGLTGRNLCTFAIGKSTDWSIIWDILKNDRLRTSSYRYSDVWWTTG